MNIPPFDVPDSERSSQHDGLDFRTLGSEAALSREWLETDGLGGFSSSTVAMAHTRRYHAFYNPAVNPPLGRMVLWAATEERLLDGTRETHLSSHHYPDTIFPLGYLSLERFEARPLPRWTYRTDKGILVRELFLVHNQGDLFLSYTWESTEIVELWVRPLLAFRNHHDLRGEDHDVAATVKRHSRDTNEFRLHPEGPSLFITTPDGLFLHDPDWYRRFTFPVETYRGLDDREDLYTPGEFALTLQPGKTVWLRAGLGQESPGPYGWLRDQEIGRRRRLDLPWLQEFPGAAPLAQAADQFIVKREERATVIAGYPWFTDWGRDTMIALPGLTLATDRPELARELILTFTEHLKDGLIPNRFPDEGELPEYNTVDATLWLAVALHHTLEATDDEELATMMLPRMRDIRDHHQRGTLHGIRVDADGLLRAGEPGVQLTWMDAKVEDWVVTPRIGKPVEIQALWVNFLLIGAALEKRQGGDPEPWCAAAEKAKAAFGATFWDPERGHLADVIDDDGLADWSLRPNQLFALSLPYPLVDEEIARSVLRAVREKLLTPRGLRSLTPGHPDYHATYGGDRRTRDAAYHQGTVWGWLHGPYMEAVLRFEGEAGRREVEALIRDWAAHLDEGCVGQIAEVFDAEPPFAPRGCPAQAWSVAEVLRIARRLAHSE